MDHSTIYLDQLVPSITAKEPQAAPLTATVPTSEAYPHSILYDQHNRETNKYTETDTEHSQAFHNTMKGTLPLLSPIHLLIQLRDRIHISKKQYRL